MKPHTFTGEPVYDRMRFGIWLKIIRPLNVKLVDFVSFPESKYSREQVTAVSWVLSLGTHSIVFIR